MDLNASRTWENLNAAFNAEARVYALYLLYAERARQEGQFAISQLFDRTARNELSHARLWHEILNAALPDTAEALRLSAEGERFERTEMYAPYAQTAREEGFENIARLFDMVAAIEGTHESKYAGTRDELLNGPSQPGTPDWICQSCGHHQPGEAAPEYCPVCRQGRGYFSAGGQG